MDQALAARERGALQEARGYCETILQTSPGDVHALCLMAAVAADAQQVEEGARLAGAAIAADPGAAEPHYVMGRLWDLQGNLPEAEHSYRKAIELQPDHARAYNNLGCVYRFQTRFAEAVTCFRRAIEIAPDQPEANQNLAAMTNDPGARRAAIEGYLRQVEQTPADTRALTNLANIYAGSERFADAMEILERVIALDPDRAEAHYSRAVLLLLSGDYAEGWQEYDWRWRMSGVLSAPMHRFKEPAWDGQEVAGSVLLHGELAFGESLQFVRYASLVARRCGNVIFECAPELRSVLQTVDGVGGVVSPGEALPALSAHLPLFCLPRLFDTTLDSIPWQGPYIHADPARVAQWKTLAESHCEGSLKVGIVWTGNPRNANNLDRSVPLQQLLRLQDIPGVRLFSLQKGASSVNADAAQARMKLIDLTSRLRDFSDTAALIQCLDLVISIDTAVAHLAGAMGVPVWVLLNRIPDWRYHLERTDNPWYPTMRLYRQEREGQWGELIDSVSSDLHGLAA
jgi:tetratricopeptide (TPR) repeat protein